MSVGGRGRGRGEGGTEGGREGERKGKRGREGGREGGKEGEREGRGEHVNFRQGNAKQLLVVIPRVQGFHVIYNPEGPGL